MQITLLLFGITTDLAGTNSTQIKLNEGATIADLKVELEKKYPQLTALQSYSFAINETYAEATTVIPANATVAVLPPVSGG